MWDYQNPRYLRRYLVLWGMVQQNHRRSGTCVVVEVSRRASTSIEYVRSVEVSWSFSRLEEHREPQNTSLSVADWSGLAIILITKTCWRNRLWVERPSFQNWTWKCCMWRRVCSGSLVYRTSWHQKSTNIFRNGTMKVRAFPKGLKGKGRKTGKKERKKA